MSEERIKCIKCDRMILSVTAEHNGGLCGPCFTPGYGERVEGLGAYSASNPGELSLNPLRWLWFRPKWPLLLTLGAVLFYFLKNWHGFFWIPFVLLLLVQTLYWFLIFRIFRIGDVNAGVIVAEKPLLVAMQTDLTKGAGEYPVIKIFRTRLPRRNSRSRKIGDRLATISVYVPDMSTVEDDDERWKDVEPYAVEVGIGNPDKIRLVEETIEESQWTALENNLAVIPKPLAPGIYFLPSPTQETGDLLSESALAVVPRPLLRQGRARN